MGFSIAASQIISNVPLVTLYMPVIKSAEFTLTAKMAFAAGSTIAGNFLIIGAASNVIIIQNAEKRSSHSLNFLQFARIGLPLTVINALVYWAYFRLLGL